MLRFARRQPSAVLLVGQLLGVLLNPFMDESHVGRALFSVFGVAILALILFAVGSTPALTWIGVLLGVPATILLLLQAVTASDDLQPYAAIDPEADRSWRSCCS